MTKLDRAELEAESHARLSETKLPGGVRVVPLSDAEWDRLVLPFLLGLLGGADRPGAVNLLDDEARERAAALEALLTPSGIVHRLALYDGDTLAGGYRGRQTEEGRYHMSITGLAPSIRRRGVYSELLDAIVRECRRLGFAEVTSRHRADDNAILVPKLRAGFVIVGFEVSLRRGLMLRLAHRFDERARELHHVRVRGG